MTVHSVPRPRRPMLTARSLALVRSHECVLMTTVMEVA